MKPNVNYKKVAHIDFLQKKWKKVLVKLTLGLNGKMVSASIRIKFGAFVPFLVLTRWSDRLYMNEIY